MEKTAVLRKTHMKNFIVEEWKLLNSSIGTVIDIIYVESNGPHGKDALPLFVVVEFKHSSVPAERKCFEDCPATYVSIPTSNHRKV